MNTINHPGTVSFSIKLKRVVWIVLSSFLFRPFVTGVFRKWRIFVLNLFGAKVSYRANVYASVKIWAPWNLEMEEGACLGPEVICYNQDKVVLRKNATVSQYSYLCTAGHDTCELNTDSSGLITSQITLDTNSWIGTRAFIGMGVIIGECAIVGATASVYKDVESYTIVGGNPSKFLKKRTIECTRNN